MKQRDILLIGGLGLLAYFLFQRQSQAALNPYRPGTIVYPGMSYSTRTGMPVTLTEGQANISNLATDIFGAFNEIGNIF